MGLSALKRLAGRIANLILSNAEFLALHEIRHLKKLIKYLEIDCVLDVGANSGQYATMLRKRVGFSGHIISFEPNPHLYKELLRRSRDDDRWHVLAIALSDTDGDVQFNIMSESQFSSLKLPSTDEYFGLSHLNKVSEVVRVPCRKLDTIFDGLQEKYRFSKVFLKMDTQGNDLAVFNGAQGVISNIHGLQSELGFKRLYQDMPIFSEALDAYRRAGFELSAMVPNNAGHFPLLLEMDCIMVSKSYGAYLK